MTLTESKPAWVAAQSARAGDEGGDSEGMVVEFAQDAEANEVEV